MAPEPWTDWHTSVCDCFEDASTCKDQWRRLVLSSACTTLACLCGSAGCYGFWCCPCLACTVSSRFGENACLPLCDLCSFSLTAAFGIPLFGAPPAALALRASIRNRYKIKVWCERSSFQNSGWGLKCSVSLLSGVTLQRRGRLLFLRVVLLVPNAPGTKLQEEQTHRHQHRQCAASVSRAA